MLFLIRQYDLVTSKKNSKLPSFVSRTDAADVGREFDYEVFLEAAVRRPVLGGRYQKMFLMGDFGCVRSSSSQRHKSFVAVSCL